MRSTLNHHPRQRCWSNVYQSARPSAARLSAIDPKKTALVLIEYQNEFAKEGGKLYPVVKGVMESTKMLENTQTTVQRAREKGVTIIHMPIIFSDDYKEAPVKDYGVLGNVRAGGAFKRGEWGSAIIDELKPAPTDVVLEGKRGLCAFAYTELDSLLKQRGIENIGLGGFLTNCCVESSMRTAYDKGYNVFTLKDACAATSQEEHDASVKYTFPMFSKPVTHAEFLAEL